MTLLNRVKAAHVIEEPFPHLIIYDVFERDLYEELCAEYPTDEAIAGKELSKNNVRFQISAKYKDRLPPVWQKFVKDHTSQAFYNQFLNVFGGFFPRHLEKYKNSRAYIRQYDKPITTLDVALDCQVGINSPVTTESSVKGPHLDNNVELFAGLFYLRHPKDNSIGGDLNIYRLKNPKTKLIPKQVIDSNLVEKIASVPYRENTFVMFLCGPQAIHGVEPRQPTKWSRRLVNVIGELSFGQKVF